jgi:hypothetical protein
MTALEEQDSRRFLPSSEMSGSSSPLQVYRRISTSFSGIAARADGTDHLFQIHRVDTLGHHADPTPDIGLQEWVRSWAAEYLLEQRL